MSRKLNAKIKGLTLSSNRLHEIERNRTPSLGTEESLVDDLFGIQPGNGHGDTNGSNDAGNRKSKRKLKIEDLEDNILNTIFEYITAEADLKSLRLVNKRFNKVSTEIFSIVHTPVVINSEDRAYSFNHDIGLKSFNFPFSRFIICLHPIPKMILRRFASANNSKIKVLYIEPYETHKTTKFMEANVDDFPPRPPMQGDQKLIWKTIEVLEELHFLTTLDIRFPSLSIYDYRNLELNRNFRMSELKFLSISFLRCGFCSFSSDLTRRILASARGLEKLRVRLPTPVNAITEARELEQVLRESSHLPFISLQLTIDSAMNAVVQTVCNAVTNGINLRIRHLTLILSKFFSEFDRLNVLLYSLSSVLISLNIYKRHLNYQPLPNLREYSPLAFPLMEKLQYLNISTHLIPIEPIDKERLPSLEKLEMHVLYGTEPFYVLSILDHLEKLRLEFHKISVVKKMIEEEYLDNLISTKLKKLQLVNPTAEHLTFMSDWGKEIEILSISCPFAYGQDPTYQAEKVLAQLRGDSQLRPGYFNSLKCLPSLKKLCLLLPVDEETARFLASDSLPRLYEIVLDDTSVSSQTIVQLRQKHHIYIPWRK